MGHEQWRLRTVVRAGWPWWFWGRPAKEAEGQSVRRVIEFHKKIGTQGWQESKLKQNREGKNMDGWASDK